MYVYDKANELARAIKESKEYIAMQEAKEAVAAKSEYMDMVKEFMKAQINIQTMTMMGSEVDEGTKEGFNVLYTSVMNVEACRKYIEAQNIFGRMIQDVYQIIGDAGDIMNEIFKDMMGEAN